MKINFDRKSIIDALSEVAVIVPQKSTLPVLTYALFETKTLGENKLLIISGTDLLISARKAIFLSDKDISEWVEDGKYIIDIKKMIALLKTFSQERIYLEITGEENHTVNIVTEKANYMIDNISIDNEFPEIFEAKENPITLTKDIWKTISMLQEYAGTDELRPIMTGIHLVNNSDELIIEATDAHMLGRIKLDSISDYSIDIVIPSAVSKITKYFEETTVMSFSDKNITIKSDTIKYTLRLIEGKYPNVEAVLPDITEASSISIDRKYLMNVINRMNISVKNETGKIAFKPSGMFLNVSAENLEYNLMSEEDISAELSNAEFEPFALNGNFLSTILSNLTSKDVLLHLINPTRAVTVIDPEINGLVHIIMPVIL